MNIDAKNRKAQFFALMDTRATRSCLNYSTFNKLNAHLSPKEVLKVVGADRGDLNSMGLIEYHLFWEEKGQRGIHHMQTTSKIYHPGC